MYQADLSQLRCLVVDDNAHMRRIVRMLLHGFGIREVIEAEDGAAGLEFFQSNMPDFVIVDWSMPIFSGLELTRMLRNPDDSPNPYVPIIMITGHSDKKRVLEARDTGVTEFICKPLSARALYQRILMSIVQPRPFIRAKSYFGPDRRRFVASVYTGEERRRSEEEVDDVKVTELGSMMPQINRTVA